MSFRNGSFYVIDSAYFEYQSHMVWYGKSLVKNHNFNMGCAISQFTIQQCTIHA